MNMNKKNELLILMLMCFIAILICIVFELFKHITPQLTLGFTTIQVVFILRWIKDLKDYLSGKSIL